jgi:beta-fructofuranosidase
VLTLSLWGEHPLAVGYYSGNYADHRFTPDQHGLVDHGSSYYAPQSFFDESGRRVMFGWLREECNREMQVAHGWSGAMSLPRVLSLDADGSLIQSPAVEVEALRKQHLHLDLEACDWFRQIDLGTIEAQSMEIDSTWEWDAKGLVAFNFCSNADEQERTVISLSVEDGEVVVDTTNSSADPGASGVVSRAALVLEPGAAIHMRVFVDVSVVEVFVNDRTCVTSRIYPRESEGSRLHISSTVAGSVNFWEMVSIHD